MVFFPVHIFPSSHHCNSKVKLIQIQNHSKVVINEKYTVCCRPDKLMELVHAFVSDHVGFKFVEPVSFDLGRSFSDGHAGQPIVALSPDVEGAAAMTSKVERLAAQRGHKLEIVSLGDNVERNRARERMQELARTGEAWILLDEFHLEEEEAGRLLEAHSRKDTNFHPGYRLWIITKETTKVRDKFTNFLHSAYHD